MQSLADLMRLFDFTADDLAANRAGQLSNRQRAQIEAQRLNASIDKASAAAAVVTFLLATLLFLALAYPIGTALGPWTLIAIVVCVVLAVGSANLAQRLSVRWLRHSAHSRDYRILRRFGRLDPAGDDAVRVGRVERLEGVLTHGDDGEHAHLLLDGEPFQAEGAADPDDRLWQLAPGIRYALYVVPEVGWVVAAEPKDALLEQAQI